MFIYAIVLKSFLVYVSDIFSAITMLTTDGWSNQIFAQCQNETGCFFIPFSVGKWLFVGCIIFSFLLVRVPSMALTSVSNGFTACIRRAQIKEDHCES